MIQVEGFNVRIVARGDGYGVNDSVVHDHDDPLVEFYDSKADARKFGKRGQFVSRYYITTLLTDLPRGLLLDSEWNNISTKGVRELQRYLRGYMLEVA